MAAPPPPRPLADHACLAVVAEGPTHGWAIVKLLAPDGELGRIWSLSRPLTYRAVDRLADDGLVDRADAGRRTELTVTPLGRRVHEHWLGRPVTHLRDLRTEFLLKVSLRARSGLGVAPLVAVQQAELAPAIAALRSTPPTDAVQLWRRESAIAAQHFLDLVGDALTSPP